MNEVFLCQAENQSNGITLQQRCSIDGLEFQLGSDTFDAINETLTQFICRFIIVKLTSSIVLLLLLLTN